MVCINHHRNHADTGHVQLQWIRFKILLQWLLAAVYTRVHDQTTALDFRIAGRVGLIDELVRLSELVVNLLYNAFALSTNERVSLCTLPFMATYLCFENVLALRLLKIFV